MSTIFISHSSGNNAAALAVSQWLAESGWAEHFLDITPARGLAPGERWQEALKSAADRCAAVLFLISPAWQASRWCLAEFLLAKQLGKTIFGVIVEEISLDSLPREMTAEWQLCDLVNGSARRTFHVCQEPVVYGTDVSFAEDGLSRLRIGLQRAGLDPSSFPWPPESDPNRAPYRGLKALEPEDAAVFFGREAAIVRGLDALRGVCDRGVERVFVILGASGAGKSSFLRAGLWPRLLRDDRRFLPLPVIRPERTVISGAAGVAASLEVAFRTRSAPRARAEINRTLAAPGGLDRLVAELQTIGMSPIEQNATPRTVIIAIDQGEELFGADGGAEAQRFLEMLAATLSVRAHEGGAASDARQRVLAIVAIRSDAYERLQTSEHFTRLPPFLFSLPPVAGAEFKAVVEGPARRHTEARHRLEIDPALTERLVRDTEGADALPLLAFTLERLFVEHGGAGKLRLEDYETLGGVRGSIEAAVEAAFNEPGRDPAVPADKSVRDSLLRSAFIPWLARVDPDTEEPKRRVVSWDELPAEGRPLLERLIAQRLLVRDRRKFEGREDAVVVEVAHEALLRQWPMLTEWLREDSQALKVLDAVRRAAAEWARNRIAHSGGDAWLVHTGERLAETEVLRRADFVRLLGSDGRCYLDACRARDERLRNEKEARVETERVAKERELAQAKALADAQGQRADAEASARIRQRRLSAALLALLVLAIGTAMYGWRQGQEANEQQRLAESGELAAESLSSLATDPARSLLLAIEAASLSYSVDGKVPTKIQDALHRVMQVTRARLILPVGGSIPAVAYSPDGSLLATGYSEGVKLWDSSSGRELRDRFIGAGKVVSIAFSPDGKRLLTAGRDVKVWDMASGREVLALRGHTALVWSVAVSPDGERVATAGRDGTVRIWESSSGRLLSTLARHTGDVFAVVFSPDGTRLATGGADGTARIWDIASEQQSLEIRAGKTIHGVAFSPDATRLATADLSETTVTFWDAASGRQLARWDGHKSSVFGVAYSPDGKRLVTWSLDKTARLWNVATGKELFALSGHTEGVISAAFSPDGKRLTTASEDKTARTWDISIIAELPALTGHTGAIKQVAYSPDGKRLATASDDATARVWDARNGQELVVVAEHHAAVNGVVFSPDGKRIATAGADNIARIFDLATGKELFALRGHEQAIKSVAFSKDGRRFATGSSDGTARIWDPATGRELATLSQVGNVTGVALNADGSRLALGIYKDVGDSRASAQLWDWALHKQLLRLDSDYLWVNQLSFSADGKRLATAGSTPPFAVQIWDAASGRENLRLLGHPAGVLALAYSPDGNLLATGGDYASAKLWDSNSGLELFDLPGISGSVNSVAFSPDGRQVATAGNDSTVRIYAVNQDDLFTLARSRVTRALTTEECRRYLRRQECSKTATSLILAGKELMKSGQREPALANFRAAMSRDGVPDPESSARKLMATLLFIEGSERARVTDLVGAKKDFQAAAELDPASAINPELEAARQVAAAKIEIADRLGAKREWGAAVELLQTATDLDPKNERAFRALAWAYNNSDQHDKAIAVMRKILEIRPTPTNLMALAEGFRMKKDYAQATDLLRRAVAIDGEYHRARRELGSVLRQAGRINEAIDELSSSLNASPDKWAYLELARAYRQRGETTLAIQSIDHAKGLDADYAAAYALAGLIYQDDLKDSRHAYREYRKAVSLLPDDTNRANFAEACLTTARFDEAYRIATDVLRSPKTSEGPDDSERLSLKFFTVAALLLQGQRAEAEAERTELELSIRKLAKFEQTWDYGATRSFLLKHPMKGSDRKLLLDLLEKVEKAGQRTAVAVGGVK